MVGFEVLTISRTLSSLPGNLLICVWHRRECKSLCYSHASASNIFPDIETFISTSVRRNIRGIDISLNEGLETKNTWARDDPAILVLISSCLAGA